MVVRLPWIKKARVIKLDDNSGRSFRNTRMWRDKVRPEQIRREPECRICMSKGILREAKQVDHIIPIAKGGAPYDYDNLQSLCNLCHYEKTALENKPIQKQ